MQILAYLLARFSEPSSYAGIGAVLALLGLHFSDTIIGQLAQFLAAGLAAAVALAACQQIADTAKQADPKLVALCDTAMLLSPLAGPYAPWITAGCGTAEAIAKLAEDPTSTAWVEKLIADVEKLRAAR